MMATRKISSSKSSCDAPPGPAPVPVRVRVRVRVRVHMRSAAARRRRPPASCVVTSQNAELQKQIEIMQDRWVCPWVPVHLCLTFARHKLENTRLEGRVQVCDVQPLVFLRAWLVGRGMALSPR